jgi:hypothetical protein
MPNTVLTWPDRAYAVIDEDQFLRADPEDQLIVFPDGAKVGKKPLAQCAFS